MNDHRAVLLLALASTLATAAHGQQPARRWYRGNTHAHTLNSDGDSPPDAIVRWYREHGYHFAFITDHEYVTDVTPLNALFAAAGKFLVISGQEVTQRVADPAHPDGVRQAHVNALGTSRVIRPLGERNIATGTTIAATYARNLAEIRKAGGVPQVNHPNFRWSVPLAELLAIPDSTLLEIANAHVDVNNLGGADSAGRWMPSTEALWDSLLTRGKTVFGVADDDAHSFRPEEAGNPDLTRPGRGWIWVRADTLSADAIVAAINRGDFYSSTGVTLADVRVDAREVRIDIAQFSDRRYVTEFIGDGGRVLASVTGNRPRYVMTGTERYVRARVTASDGRRAWTQPVMARRGTP
jgi:hypothetical protein